MKRNALAVFVAAGTALAAAVWSEPAEAAPEFVHRHITLPRHDWAFDLALGFGHYHYDNPNVRALNGPGFNFEMGVGITERVELGIRGGIAFGDDARALRADVYGRMFDRQTFGVGGDTFSNHEVRVRGALVRGHVFELGLEGRATIPFETGTRPGVQFGLPMAFHFGDSVRMDLGVYVPVVFYDPDPYWAVSVPLDVWIQVSHKVALGPLTGLRLHRGRFRNDGPNVDRTDFSLGFGLSFAMATWADLKAMLLFPSVNEDGGRSFGAGIGVQLRIE
jgi:opacity protein-like surface antigen